MSSSADSTGMLAAPRTETPASRAGASVKERVENLLAIVFGVTFITLAVVVTVETIARKVFNFSLQGADELGGYALALGSTLSFSLALLGRNHIRVDVFHEKMPRRLQAFLNWISIVLLAALAVFIAVLAFKVIGDTLQYRSTAPTPWQTPLIWPQSVWYAGLLMFAFVAVALALRASKLYFGGDLTTLNHEFPPKSVKEELKEELEDLGARQGTGQGAP
jgi:TRAP-type C4-dicarboxylate transport system permease small subunit